MIELLIAFAAAVATPVVPMEQPSQSLSAFSTKSLYKMLKAPPQQAFTCNPSREGAAQYRRLTSEIARRTDGAIASRKKGGSLGNLFDEIADGTGIDGGGHQTQRFRQDCTPEYEARALNRQANLMPILIEYEHRR